MRYLLPDFGEAVVDSARGFTEQTRLYLLQLGQILSGDIHPKIKRYVDLVDLQDKVPNPEVDKIYGVVTGQGLALWNGSNWVKAADDTTNII